METKRDRNVAITILFFSIITLLYTFTIPGNASKYPIFVLVLAIVFSLAQIIVKQKLIINYSKENDSDVTKKLFNMKQILLLIILFLYIFSIKYFGFFVPSVFFLFTNMFYLGYRKWAIMIIISLLGAYSLYFTFFRFLHLPSLPEILF